MSPESIIHLETLSEFNQYYGPKALEIREGMAQLHIDSDELLTKIQVGNLYKDYKPDQEAVGRLNSFLDTYRFFVSQISSDGQYFWYSLEREYKNINDHREIGIYDFEVDEKELSEAEHIVEEFEQLKAVNLRNVRIVLSELRTKMVSTGECVIDDSGYVVFSGSKSE